MNSLHWKMLPDIELYICFCGHLRGHLWALCSFVPRLRITDFDFRRHRMRLVKIP